LPDELLSQYGWCLQNAKERTWPVGSKKPNDLGLFDMHGNLYAWCQDNYRSYPIEGDDDKVSEDKEDNLDISPTTKRVLRSGSFLYRPTLVRSAIRHGIVPGNRDDLVGLRPARTFR
jgi:formylglycine-generating enzyme required for sulfatase activity